MGGSASSAATEATLAVPHARERQGRAGASAREVRR